MPPWQTRRQRATEKPDSAKPRQACQAIAGFVRVSGASSGAAVLEPLVRFLRFRVKLAGVRLVQLLKRSKVHRLMSQPYSPTGKRFTRPIIYKPLQRKPQPRAAAPDFNREKVRRLVVALGIAIAVLLTILRIIDAAAGGKFLPP